MKKIILLLVILFMNQFAGNAQIQFKSGNAEMDANLNSMNVNAKLDLGKFKADLSLTYGLPSIKIENLFSLNMEPAEVFLSLEMASITNKPVDDVVTAYKSNKGKGWGVIAKELGIKPGSPEFHALKNKSKGKGNKGEKGNNGNGKGNGKGKGNK